MGAGITCTRWSLHCPSETFQNARDILNNDLLVFYNIVRLSKYLEFTSTVLYTDLRVEKSLQPNKCFKNCAQGSFPWVIVFLLNLTSVITN